MFTQILSSEHEQKEYRRRKDEEKVSIHWGQRKLLLSLINFLSNHCQDILNPVVVYAGAAPGVNIGIVADLFPKIEWHLYDPAKFKIQTDFKRKIIVYNKKFTLEAANYWSKKDVIFISDIRTADYTKVKNLNENEEQIISDMCMQKEWVEIIRPIRTQLKFRPNYTGENRETTLDYFDGILYKQAWAPQTSSETRLVLSSPDLKYKTYDCQKYEYQMFYHNVVWREEIVLKHEFADGEELTFDWDSYSEIETWKKYLEVIGKDVNKENVLKMSTQATKMLTQNRKYKDTLKYLRENPQAIKNRNFNR